MRRAFVNALLIAVMIGSSAALPAGAFAQQVAIVTPLPASTKQVAIIDVDEVMPAEVIVEDGGTVVFVRKEQFVRDDVVASLDISSPHFDPSTLLAPVDPGSLKSPIGYRIIGALTALGPGSRQLIIGHLPFEIGEARWYSLKITAQ